MLALMGAGAASIAKNGPPDPDDQLRVKKRTFKTEELADLKKTKTHFVLTDKELANRQAYETAVKRVWTFTPIDFISFQEIDQYLGEPGHSFFVMEGIHTDVERSPGGAWTDSYTHFFLTLLLPKTKLGKKDKIEDVSIRFCRVELTPDAATIAMTMKEVARDSAEELVIGKLYAEGGILNRTPAMLSLYLAEVQKNLNKGYRSFLFEQVENKDALKKLEKTTLYVPEILLKANAQMKDKDDPEDVKTLFKKYEGKYKIVSESELDGLLANASKPIYVLDYVQSCTDKFVTIYKSGQGVVYRDYAPVSRRLKSKDLGKIL